MKKIILCAILIPFFITQAQNLLHETKTEHDARMQWWRDARFGMFIHWGLYAVPAGEWNGKIDYGEWIRTNAEIPIDIYDKFVSEFNPVKFNAEEWVKTAKSAGMKYIVITSKHHDGFCLFNSEYTDFDIMSTPFHRDVLKELADACSKNGIKLCFYYSIMDWHHPDYLPRRDWEKTRSTQGADYNRYLEYMKNELRELLTNYGDIGVLWFDGEWENTWNDKLGTELYNYVRSLKPDVIINNRVGASRSGMNGFSENESPGDFGTPEQQIPSTGLPGVDWETCMTMNTHWGYNKNDKKWKSSTEIIRMLSDIASKGGNYLLNVGPTAEGVFPPESIDRLKEIGEWMNVNGESIYGTSASPFINLEWGRCTQKNIGDKTRLYFHVFDWPSEGKLIIPGIFNTPEKIYLLSDKEMKELSYTRNEDALVIAVPREAPDKINTVLVMDIKERADINNPPSFKYENNVFIDSVKVTLYSERENVEIRYTTDGSVPTIQSDIAAGTVNIGETGKISARCFRNGKPVSPVSEELFTKVKPVSSVNLNTFVQGISFGYFEGNWNTLPDFDKLQPVEKGTMQEISLEGKTPADHFGMQFTGYIRIPEEGIYTFSTASDDGSRLFIGDSLVADNDGLHGKIEKSGVIALRKGFHPLKVEFFDKSGGEELQVFIKPEGGEKIQIPGSLLYLENK